MDSFDKVEGWFKTYHQDIYNFLIYYTGRSDVDDLVQDVFIKAMKAAERFEGKSKVKTWLFSIARNVAIDHQRKRKIRSFLQINNDMVADLKKGPEAVYELHEETRELYHAIWRLKKQYREVVILRGIKELSIKETAEILDWNEVKVRVSYHRALKQLHTLMDHEGSVFHGSEQ